MNQMSIGDIFYIKWLNVLVAIWSMEKESKYLYFNSIYTKYCFNKLFCDQIPPSGHFEPLLSYSSMENVKHKPQLYS